MYIRRCHKLMISIYKGASFCKRYVYPCGSNGSLKREWTRGMHWVAMTVSGGALGNLLGFKSATENVGEGRKLSQGR